jgi:uncharacterized protein
MTAPAAADRAVAAGLLDRIGLLVGDLRRSGVPIGLTGVVEASAAVGHVNVTRREHVRVALRATLVTRAEDLPVFDALFDARFAPPRPEPLGRAGGRPDTPGPLRDRLVDALASGDVQAVEALAAESANRYAGFDATAGSAQYRLARTLRALDAGSLAGDVLRARRVGPRRDGLTGLVDRADTAVALDRFLAALAAQILRRGLEESSPGSAPIPAPVRIEDVDIAGASAVELHRLRQTVRPLARRLAARLARRRPRPRGALDMRRTIRRSVSSGGVPLDPALRRRHPHRPDLWLLCDVSGSVAEYARFTIGLLCAIHDEVPRLRSFLFVDDVVEVTDVLERRRHELDPFAVVAGAGAPLGGRRSDWGRALARFRDDHLAELTPRSTVLVTGDARTHDHDPRPDVVSALARRTRGIWLLDPEPAAEWAADDAAVVAYIAAGMRVREVRTLAHLAAAVEDVLVD